MSTMKKIYVGNLNYQTTEEGLRQLFEQCGNIVSATVIIDKFSNRSKGFGFVEFETIEAANSAVTKFNDTTLDGRQIRVNLAKEQTPGGDRRSFGSKPSYRDRDDRGRGA